MNLLHMCGTSSSRGEGRHTEATLVWAFANASTNLGGIVNSSNSNSSWSIIADRSSDSQSGLWSRLTGGSLWGSARNPHKSSARVGWSERHVVLTAFALDSEHTSSGSGSFSHVD
jgi:hypothetical protein